MKSQIKRFSKSTLSVILSLCMLVSCMTVGIIATDAAYDNGEGVGYYYSGGTYYMQGSFNGWDALSGTNNSSNTQQHYYYIYTNGSSTDADITFKFKEADGSGNESWFGAGDTDSIGTTGKTIYENGGQNIHLNRKNLGTTSTTWYKVKVWFEHASTCYCWYEKDTTKTALTPTLSTKKDSTSTDSFDVGDTVSLSTSTTNNFGTVTYTYQYKIGDGTYQDISGTSFTPSTAGTYTIKVTANDSAVVQGTNSESARTATAEKTITVSNPTYTVAGENSLTGGTAWDPANTDNDMVLSDSSYTKTFYNIAAGTYKFKIVKNHSWDGNIGYSENVSRDGLVTDVSAEDGDGSNIVFTTSGSANITITFTPTSTIVINAVSNLTPLDAPTNIKLNNASSDLTVDTTVVGAKITLSWNTVANAGTYKVYKGETLVDTVSTLFYDIERAYSSTGTYTVVAVPSDDNTYIESPKSTELTLTVNKSKLNKPTISVQPTDIKTGSSVELTVTDTNTGFTASQFNYYYYTGSSVSIDNNHLMTPGVAKTLSPTSDTTYKACAYPVNGENNDYYLQSDTEGADVVYVSTPAWHLTGDLVTGQGGATGWPTQITTYPVDTFVSHNIFYTSVTVSGGAATAKHYFRLTNQTNQYGNGSDTDMADYDGSTSSKKLTCSTTGTSGAMYVTGNGTFKIYVDQSSSSAPKVWVVNNEWSITSTAYYQTYNLTNDAYNAAQEGTTGGTVSGDVEVVKGTSTTLTATPATGYAFDGWYSNTDFAAAHKVYSNASYTFTPSANGDYYALFKKIVNRYNVKLSFTSTQANVSATYHGTTISTNGATMSVPEGATVTYSISAKTGAQIDSVSPSSLSTGTNKTFTMPSAARTITVTSSWKEYTLNGVTSPSDKGTVTFYSDSECEESITKAIYNQVVYAKYTPGEGYQLKSFSISGTGSSITNTNGNIATVKVGYADVEITATVVLQYTVTYYVDMHDNRVDSLSFAVVESNSDTSSLITDKDNDGCIATLGDTDGKYQLTKQGSSTVYAATITTPVKLSGTTYSDLYFRITFNGKNYTTKISGGNINATTCIVRDLIRSGEIWLEAENESSQTLNITYSTAFNPETGSTPAVATGYRRIYLAKPYGWQDTETNWKNIKVYHWGTYDDMGWNNGISMSYLGYGRLPGADSESTDVYHYYYIDLPKYVNKDRTLNLNTNGTGNKVQNIIFQGWADNATSPSIQTGNIEGVPDSANFYILSKDGSAYNGTASDSSVIIPTFARRASSIAMNVGQTGVNIAPVKVGANVTYKSSNSDKVSVSSSGDITAHASTVGEINDIITITVKVYGSIGAKISDTSNGGGEPSNGADAVTYTVRVSVHDPSIFNGFEIMSLNSKTYTVEIPKVDSNGDPVTTGGTQPGYFDMDNTVITVEGIHGVESSTNSAIITQTTQTISGVGTVCTSFTVKYAEPNSLFTNYSGINVIGKIVSKSIKRTGAERYGHDRWAVDGTREDSFTTSKVIDNGVETATTNGIAFDNSKSTYSAVFVPYTYVDVNFTFKYYEYKPEVDADGMINYPYDATWAGNEDRSSDKFEASHTQKTYTVSNFEIRKLEKGDIFDKTIENIDSDKLDLLVDGAVLAIGVKPDNNYYDYQITANTIPLNEISEVKDEDDIVNEYSVNVTVNMTHSVKTYKVYLNGEPIKDSDNQVREFSYQEYAELTVNTASDWYAVESETDTNTANAPLLATGKGYKFRVKGDTYLRTVTGTSGVDPLRSEVDFSHYEVIHRDNPTTTQVELVEYLLQNFYIADFFSPANVLDPQSYTGKGKFGVAYKVEEVTAPTTASSGDITVYFTDSLDWNNICIYYWGENINNINWPGLAMTQSGTDEDNKKIYSAVIPGTAEGVIFTGNNNQTVDITNNIANGSHWKSKSETVQNGIPYDDAQFVGGGVVYYSMNGVTENSQGTPFANAVSAGYVDGSTGKINEDAVKEMLKTNIEAQYGVDKIAGTAGEETAMKVAYGTEIAAKKNVEGGFNTGIIYRYLPLNQYKRDNSGAIKKYSKNAQGEYVEDENGEYVYEVNTNTFRYSNSLQSYQYVYASGNENKETNNGRNMRLYSYYVYSYVTYNKDTNVPETKYEIVLSDNYSDASTYWDGTN